MSLILESLYEQKYMVSRKQVSGVNILIKVVEEAMERGAFSEEEKEKIRRAIRQVVVND